MSEYNSKYEIICFGETLWDVFPDQELPGGAPMNVAVHLNNFKIEAAIASRVGVDTYGTKLLQFLDKKQVPIDLVQIDNKYPTGIVKVDVSDKRNVTYDIIFPSSWDYIELHDNLIKHVADCEVLLFGSLAARNDESRKVLMKLLDVAKKKVFDVNLRYPHYERDFVLKLVSKTNILKVNETELKVIGEWLGISGIGNIEAICSVIDLKYNVDMIIVTLGNKGAMVFEKGQAYFQNTYDVEVVDTIGSGDAFLAAFLAQQAKGASIGYSLDFACAAGSFVASNKGALPEYSEKEIKEVMENYELLEN
jgi:fructokinase